jgi:hypothetical protein
MFAQSWLDFEVNDGAFPLACLASFRLHGPTVKLRGKKRRKMYFEDNLKNLRNKRRMKIL